MADENGEQDDDELDLWQRIAQSAKPLKARNRLARVALPQKAKAKPKDKAEKATAPTPKPPPRPKPSAPPAATSMPLDRRSARALERGRLAVDARIDLHGLRQREAHTALKRFLVQAQKAGHRHVLVITGKGTERVQSQSFYDEEPRGVLKQAVPGWLAQADFAGVVLSFSEAPRRLGGEGALYVRLKRARG